MGKYDFGIDLSNENTTYTKIIHWTGNNKRVLEIGCHTGTLSKYLIDKGCNVTGVEIDSEAVIQAKKICNITIEGNIETDDIYRQISNSFDVIIFADVLEHLVSPDKILVKVKNLLSPEAYILISLPNIAHWSVRRNLMMGRFQYQEVGLMDKTHLHFYTLDSFKQWLGTVGYTVVKWEPISNYNWFDFTFLWAKPLYKIKFIGDFLNKLDKLLSRLFPKLFGYQFVFKIKPIG